MTALQGNTFPWSSMPIPPGWEAKYEPNVGRYFYINHATKKTQWVDPRKAAYEAQQAQQRSPAQPMAYIPLQPIAKPKCRTCRTNEVDVEGGTCNPCKVTEQQREISLMRARESQEAEKQRQEQKVKLEKERERRRAQSAQRRQEAKQTPPVVETTFNEPPIDKEAAKREMRHLFANTQSSVVDMILETYDFNKEEAKIALRQMGQRIVNQPLAKKSSPKSSPKKAAQKAAQKAAPMTRAQKQQVIANLKKKFPHVNDMMIEMAVESTNYSIEKSSAILHMLKTDSSGPSKGGASRKEVTFPESKPSPPSTTTVTSSSASGVSTSDSQKRPTTSAVVSSPSKKSAAAASSSSSSSPSSRKPMASGSKSAMPSKKTTTGPKKQAHYTPIGSKYAAHGPASYNSSITGAKGPDPTLVKGPDRSNLLQDYTQNMGPNPDNLSGSNKENIMGPVARTGSDPTLAMGPESANCMGPEPNLAKGSMYN